MSTNAAANVVIDIVRSDGTIVQIVKSTRTTEESVAIGPITFTTGMTSGAYTSQTLNRGDRLRIRVFADDAGTLAADANGFWLTYNGNAGVTTQSCSVTFTENITFDSAPGADAPAISQGTLNAYEHLGGGAANGNGIAQSFAAPAIGSITRVVLTLEKSGSPTDNVVVEIRTDSGGAPSSTVLASASTGAAGLIVGTDTDVSFSVPCSLTPSATYWIVITRSGSFDVSNYPICGISSSDVYASGIKSLFSSGSWQAIPSSDVTFVVYAPTATGSVIYLTDTASDVSTASVDREAWTSRGSGVQTDVTNTAAGFTAPIQVTDTAGGTVVDWFTKRLQAFTLTALAVGNIRALESNVAANASIRVEIARVAADGTSPTVWASWNMSANNTRTGELNTTETAETVNVSGDDLAISAGQRLRIRLYIDDMPTTAMGASQTVTTYYAGTSGGASGDTYITFPQTLTEYATAAPPVPRRPLIVGGTAYQDRSRW
jgi:carbon monoxide dehydrogenase subunit G